MDNPAEPLLRVRASVDAAEWERMHAAVIAMSCARLEVLHRRRVSRILKYLPKPHPRMQKIIYGLGATGLIVSALMAAAGGIPYHGYRLELLFAVFFIVTMVLTYYLPAIEAAQNRRRPAFHYRIARGTANRVLKTAKKALPFDAEYRFFEDKVAYTRITGDKARLRWRLGLKGVQLQGDGFTLLYKKHTSQEPYGILLHAAPEVEAQLERLGVQPMAAMD